MQSIEVQVLVIRQLTINFTCHLVCCMLMTTLFDACVKAFHRGDCTRGGKFQNPKKDYALSGHVIASLGVASRLDCTFECLSNPQCLSINYAEGGELLHTCELSDRSRKNYPSKLMSKLGWTYYDNDEGGVNCGESIGAEHSNCKESCNEAGLKTNHWNDCPSFKTGANCELWTGDASVFEVNFPNKTTSDFGIIELSRNSISGFTISMWINPTRTDTYAVLSYATNAQKNEIYLECTAMSYCVLKVKGAERKFFLGRTRASDLERVWHHLCVRWSRKDGEWRVYVDGALRKLGRSFKDGALISGKGTLVLGQRQTVLGGGFDKTLSYQGEMAQVNIWSEIMNDYKIKKLAEKCIQGGTGNIVAWRQLRHKFHGEITIGHFMACKSRVSIFSYYFQFPSRNIKNYVEPPTLDLLNAFTLCFWLRMESLSHKGTGLFSYATSTEPLAITLHLGGYGRYNVELLSLKRKFDSAQLDGNHWINLCVTWENVDGKFHFYVDGVMRKILKDYQKGKTIPSGGIMRLGVKQSSKGVNEAERSFAGDLSHVNMWSLALSAYTIEAMAKEPGTDIGNLISWPDLKGKAQGTVKTRTSATYDLTSRLTDFDLDFGENRSTANYAVYKGTVPALSKFTVCAWFRPKLATDALAIFSYATTTQANEIYFHTTNRSPGHRVYLVIKGKSNTIEFSENIRSTEWHHLCVTWTSFGGKWNIYVNGLLKGNNQGLKDGETIDAGGKLIVGQDQDSYGGGFEERQAMVGLLSKVNVWNRVLHSTVIEEMATGGDLMEGNAVAWHLFRNGRIGSLEVLFPSGTTLPGITLQTIRNEYCTSRYAGTSGRTGCSSTDMALFSKTHKTFGRLLRCYAVDMLKEDESGYSYDEDKGGSCFNSIPGSIRDRVE